MIGFSILALLVGAFCGFILGAKRMSDRACRLHHDWKNITSKVKESGLTVTKQKCTCCGERREKSTHLLR